MRTEGIERSSNQREENLKPAFYCFKHSLTLPKPSILQQEKSRKRKGGREEGRR